MATTLPGISGNPLQSLAGVPGVIMRVRLTAIYFLSDHIGNSTLVLLGDTLRLESWSGHIGSTVQMLLKRIILPAEEIIGVSGIARLVTTGPDKWLAAICWPICLVVEGFGVPDSLQKDLRESDRVGVRTFATGFKGTGLRVTRRY